MITWVVWHWVPGRKIPRGQGWKMETHGSREMEVSVLGTVTAPDRAQAQWIARRDFPHLHEIHVQSATAFQLSEQETRALSARITALRHYCGRIQRR